MSDDLSQLDELDLDGIFESDILDALDDDTSKTTNTSDLQEEPSDSDMDDASILIEDLEEETNEPEQEETSTELVDEPLPEETQETVSQNTSLNAMELESSSVATLLSELLKNKTLEITIKIKD